MPELGDLKVTIFLDVKKFEDGTKKVVVSLKNVEAAEGKAKSSTDTFTASTVKQGTELEKLKAKYDQLTQKLNLYYDAGKKGTLQYKQMETDQRRLFKEISNLEQGLTKTGRASEFFRTKSVNLGADLVILSYGVRGIISDVKTLGDELGKTDKDFGVIAESSANATITFLAMVPALKALGSILPKVFLVGSAALAQFALQVAMVVKVLKDLPSAIDSVKQILSGANIWDLWIDKTAELTGGLIDLRSQINNTASDLYTLSGSIWNAYGQFYQSNIMVGPPEANIDSKKITEWRRGLEKPPSGRTGTGTKKEVDPWAEFTKTFNEQLEHYREYNTLTNENLQSLLAQLEANKSLADTLSKQTEYLRMLKDLYREINKGLKLDGFNVLLGPEPTGDIRTRIPHRAPAGGVQRSSLGTGYDPQGADATAKASEIAVTNFDKMVQDLQAMNSLAGDLKNILGEGSEDFLAKMQQAIQIIIMAANLMKKQKSGGGVEFGDILGIFGGFLKLAFLAEGGPAAGSQPYIVGERGPELFVPDSNGYVIPNFLMPYLKQAGQFSQYREFGGRVTAPGGYGQAIYLNGRILDDAAKRDIASRGIYLENLSVDSGSLN